MKKIYFTPGPSATFYTLDDHIKQALRFQIPSIAHRGKEFLALFRETTDNLRSLLNLPTDYHIAFTSSATEIWERIGECLIDKKSFHLVNGAFSGKFANAVNALGKTAVIHTTTPGSSPDIVDIDIPDDVELIGLAQNETSTGVSFPVEDIYELRNKYPDMLIAVDGVSSIPVVDLDYSNIDMAYFSVQKCFGLPAGLGVWVFNEKSLQRARALQDRNVVHQTYNTLINLAEYAAKNQTPCTPNVLGIYLLGKVAIDMLEKGLDVIRRESRHKATLLYHMYRKNDMFSPFVNNENQRSQTVAVANVPGGSDPIIKKLEKYGMIIGNGYGQFKGNHIRIASFPTHSKEQIEHLVDTINSIDL